MSLIDLSTNRMNNLLIQCNREMRLLVLWCSLMLVAEEVRCKNILYASEMVSPSHKIWNFALAEGLTQRGHNVTMLGPESFTNLGKSNPSYHPIYLEGLHDHIMRDFNPIEGEYHATKFHELLFFYDYTTSCCEFALQTKGLQMLLDYPEDFKFDVILFDITISGCLLPLMKRFNYPPAVGVTAFLLPYYLSTQFGNDLHPSYVPSFLVNYNEDMDFHQRLYHYVWMNVDLLLRKYYMKPKLDRMLKSKFGNDTETLLEMEDRMSLLLSNFEPSFNVPQPTVPNIVSVGGLHVKPGNKLPKDLEEIVVNAKDGVILFAMGTNVRSDQLGAERIKHLLNAFGQIKQTVLWKFESSLSDYSLPNNVVIRKWLPQNDILAHPNTRLFISHAGGLSTMEASYHGVPVLGIPVFVDQFQNIALMVSRGSARQLDFRSLTSQLILSNLNEMLDNPRYSEAAKETSRRMRDQPMQPMERAVFWIEYAIRHNGTKFLDTRARRMPLIASTSTDVKLFLLSVLAMSLLIITKIISTARKYSRESSKSKKD